MTTNQHRGSVGEESNACLASGGSRVTHNTAAAALNQSIRLNIPSHKSGAIQVLKNNIVKDEKQENLKENIIAK